MCRPGDLNSPPRPQSSVGKLIVQVLVAVRNAAAVDDHRLVEQVGVAFLGVLELDEELAEQLRMQLVDLLHLAELVLPLKYSGAAIRVGAMPVTQPNPAVTHVRLVAPRTSRRMAMIIMSVISRK